MQPRLATINNGHRRKALSLLLAFVLSAQSEANATDLAQWLHEMVLSQKSRNPGEQFRHRLLALDAIRNGPMPLEAVTQRLLGDAYFGTGDFRKAQLCYERAVNLLKQVTSENIELAAALRGRTR